MAKQAIKRKRLDLTWVTDLSMHAVVVLSQEPNILYEKNVI